MIKFNMYNITDTVSGLKVKVSYSHGMDIHGKMRVWIYEQGYTRNLFNIFNNAINESDLMSDYCEETRVCFYENDAEYNSALEMVKKREAAYKKSYENRMAKKKAA